MKDPRLNGFLIIGFCAWALGTTISIFLGLSLSIGLSSFAETLAAVFFIFALCVLFFGKLSAFPMFFAGLVSGPLFFENAILGIASFFSFILAAFGGTWTGLKLADDFHGTDNFYSDENLKQLGFYLGMSLVLALLPALLQDSMPLAGINQLSAMIGVVQ